MKEIKLTQGKVALVDDEEFEYLNQWKWYAQNYKFTFYAVRTINYYNESGNRTCRRIWMHRLIMKTPKSLEVDHINHNGWDNRKENLRNVTRRENCINRKNPNKTGYTGAYLIGHKYMAGATIKGKRVYLGYYNTAKEAENTYKEHFKLNYL